MRLLTPPVKLKIGAVLCLVSLLTVLTGQFLLTYLYNLAAGLVLFGLGGILFLLGLFFQKQTHHSPIGVADNHRRVQESAWLIAHPTVRTVLVALSIVASTASLILVIYKLEQSGAIFLDALALWAAGIVLLVTPFLRKGTRDRPPTVFRSWYPVSVAALVLLAFALRFHQLGSLPVVMDGDEADIGVQALAVTQGRLTNVFSTYRSYGALQFFLLSVPVKVFGPTQFGLRLFAAVAGVLTVPALAVLSRRLFGPTVGLASTALYSVSHAAIHFSHITIAGTLDPLFAVVTTYLLHRGLVTRQPLPWLLAGLTMGIAVHFYVGARAIPVSVLLFLALLLVFDRSRLWANRRGLILMGVGAWVAVSPLLPWLVLKPDTFNIRVNQTGILQSGWLTAESVRRGVSPLWLLLERFENAALIFNYRPLETFYQADVPMLGLLSGGLFVLGLAYALVNFRQTRFLLLHSWFWVTFIAGQVLIITSAGYRTLSLVVVACMLAGVALERLARAVSVGFASRRLLILMLTVPLLAEAQWNIDYYYTEWAPGYQYCTTIKCRSASLLADYAARFGDNAQIYVFNDSVLEAHGWAVTEYIAHGRNIVEVGGSLPQALPEIQPHQRIAFVFGPTRLDELSIVMDRYPGGRRTGRALGDQLFFAVYEIEP